MLCILPQPGLNSALAHTYEYEPRVGMTALHRTEHGMVRVAIGRWIMIMDCIGRAVDILLTTRVSFESRSTQSLNGNKEGTFPAQFYFGNRDPQM